MSELATLIAPCGTVYIGKVIAGERRPTEGKKHRIILTFEIESTEKLTRP